MSGIEITDVVDDEGDVNDEAGTASAAGTTAPAPSSVTAKPPIATASLDKLYANREMLVCIFRYFDTDASGAISKEEFDNGVTVSSW